MVQRRQLGQSQKAPQPRPGVGPTSSMKAPTKLEAARPSSSSLKQVSVMFLRASGPCRRPGTRRRPTRMEPKSARATRKGTGGERVCQAREPPHAQTQAWWEPPQAPAPHTRPRHSSTVGVQRLAKGRPLGHSRGQDEVLEAGQREDHRVLVVGQVVRCGHRPVQRHEPGGVGTGGQGMSAQRTGQWWDSGVGSRLTTAGPQSGSSPLAAPRPPGPPATAGCSAQAR